MFRIRLKEVREKANMSQKELADKLSVSQSTVGNWESGMREPNFDTIKKIAEFFDVTVDYLLGRTDDPKYSNPLDKELEGVDFALWGEIKDLNDAQKQDILDYIRFKKSQSR